MLNYFPKYFTTKAIVTYFIVLLTILIVFNQHVMVWYGWVFGIIAVVSFFYFTNVLTKKWSNNISKKNFSKKLFWISFSIRIVWVVFSYYFYLYMTGTPFEFGSADAVGYNQCGVEISDSLRKGYWWIFDAFMNLMGPSDAGYISYLGVLYYIFDDSIFIARLIKALLSAATDRKSTRLNSSH